MAVPTCSTEEEEEEEKKEEDLFKANAVNEEDPERDRATHGGSVRIGERQSGNKTICYHKANAAVSALSARVAEEVPINNPLSLYYCTC